MARKLPSSWWLEATPEATWPAVVRVSTAAEGTAPVHRERAAGAAQGAGGVASVAAPPGGDSFGGQNFLRKEMADG